MPAAARAAGDGIGFGFAGILIPSRACIATGFVIALYYYFLQEAHTP